MATIISPRNFPDSKDVENHSPASSNQKPRNKRANSKKGLKNSTDQNRNNENSNGQSIDSRNPNQVGGDIKKNKSRPKKKNQNAMRDKGQMSKVRETRDANGQVIQPVNKPNKNKRRNNRRKRKAQITATSPTNITATSPTNLKVVHGINLQDFITKAEEKNKSAEKIRAIVSPKVDVANVTDLHCDEELKIESPVPVKVTNNGHAVFMNALATEVAEMALASPSPVETRQEFDFEQMESVRAIKSFVTESVASDEAVRGISESLLVMETIPDEPVAVTTEAVKTSVDVVLAEVDVDTNTEEQDEEILEFPPKQEKRNVLECAGCTIM